MQSLEEQVVIVGAGLAGIAASYYLSKSNIPHILLEKASKVGGIWSAMNWPGIRCDTEIINYSYSFRPYTSDHHLISGPEISKYLQTTADELGITRKIRFNTEVHSAEFSTNHKRWQLHTNKGLIQTKFLINANGYFNQKPHIPEFEGINRFKGELMHLFDLDDTTLLKDRRIVLVGSGASAISAVPELTAAARSMTLLQRSPSYIWEQNNDVGFLTNTAQILHHAGFSAPLRMVNLLLQLRSDLIFVLFRKMPWTGKLIFRQHWKNVVDKLTYEEHFKPTYNPWQQRIPVATGLKEIIRKKKLRLVTGQIQRFTESGLQLRDGRFIETDLCILATGFNLSFFHFQITIDGKPVDTRQINFFKSMMMGGIPNYFQPFGPPHTSFTRRVETVSKLMAKIIGYMRSQGLGTVMVARRKIKQAPRITPNYIMRDLDKLPVFYGSTELPTIDNLLYFRFRKSDYIFTGPRTICAKSHSDRGHTSKTR